MIRIFVTTFAALAGLAFGSFLNVCLSRWPQGESVVKPRSHCRTCGRTLAWWENIPLLSWLALRGHCRTCKAAISWRYPAVELAVSALWALQAMLFCERIDEGGLWSPSVCYSYIAELLFLLAFVWLLVALAFLDAEYLWLPDKLTLPGILLGFVSLVTVFELRAPAALAFYGASQLKNRMFFHIIWQRSLVVFAAAFLILAIRWLYRLFRHREGLGLGDAKLMAMLAAWLGLPGALLSFAIGVILGAVVGVVVLARGPRADAENPALAKLPLGTFLCIGGIVASLWGQPIIAAYMRYAGFN